MAMHQWFLFARIQGFGDFWSFFRILREVLRRVLEVSFAFFCCVWPVFPELRLWHAADFGSARPLRSKRKWSWSSPARETAQSMNWNKQHCHIHANNIFSLNPRVCSSLLPFHERGPAKHRSRNARGVSVPGHHQGNRSKVERASKGAKEKVRQWVLGGEGTESCSGIGRSKIKSYRWVLLVHLFHSSWLWAT